MYDSHSFVSTESKPQTHGIFYCWGPRPPFQSSKAHFCKFCEIGSFPQNHPGALCGTMWHFGALSKTLKKSILAILVKFGVFLKLLRDSMWHYVALSKTLKQIMFANFVKFGVFLKIIWDIMWHYGALSKALKKCILAIFCEIWRFLKIIGGTMWHFGVLSKSLKMLKKSFLQILWNCFFSSKSSGALCGTMGRYQKRWKLHFGHALVPVINEQAKSVAHRTQTFHAVFPDSHPATALGLQMPDLSDTNPFATDPSNKHQTDWTRMSFLSWKS